MTITPVNDSWDVEVVDPKLEYRALVNSLTLTQGFGLVFVQCSPSEGERLIAKVRTDLPKKQIQVLSLSEPTDTLFDKVEALYQSQPMDVLFVQGIEHSLFQYEQGRLWQNDAQRLSYSETGVPRLLQHLNLNREKFQEHFPLHFVFLVPHFALKYLIRRAPDFCDWNSGIFELPMESSKLFFETEEAIYERLERDDPRNLTPEECHRNALKIQALIEEPYQSEEEKADLLFEQARLFEISGFNEEAISSYDKALQVKPDKHGFWYNRGIALGELGRYEEAIASYDRALKVKPDKHAAWYNRGIALGELGRYEEAIASYDRALKIKPDKHAAWNNRGIALGELGRYEEAIASYDRALKIKPDDHEAWNNRGAALSYLGRYEEAITSYDKALQIMPDDHELWYNRGIALRKVGRYEEAITSYDKALQIMPDKYAAWDDRGFALSYLGRYNEAIASFDKALQIMPDANAFYNKACAYALQSNLEAALENLSKAVALNPDEYLAIAKTDSDFDALREDERFQALVQG
jgi:tetratricopeptide (TPR) repeat protein